MVSAPLHFAALPSLTFQRNFEDVTRARDLRTEVDKGHVLENTVSANPRLAA